MSYSSEVLADSPLVYLRLGDAPPIAAVTPSSQFNTTTEAAVNAFDGSAATQWTTNGTATGWVRAQLTSATTLTSYKILGRRDAFPNRSPKDWTFEGSNDGSSWTTLDTQSAITWTSGQVRTFTFSNSTAYLYYRLNVSANTGDTYLNVPDLTLVGVNPGTLADSSGSSRSANIQGPVWRVTGLLTGDSDGAASFDGANSVAFVPSASALNVSSFTVEAWIKTSKTSDYQYIITRDTQARQWDFRLKPNGNLEFEVISPSVLSIVASVTLNDGATHHVVATFDGTNVRLYVDGTIAQTTSASVTNSVTADLSVGAAMVGTGSYGIHSFQGTIDEPAYYGSALSGTRVAAHYTAGTTASADGTVTAVAATATASAPAPTLSAGWSVTAVAATASATALPPVVSTQGDATVAAVAATATASAAVPVLHASATVVGSAAAAIAAALVPTLSRTTSVSAVAAAATATAHAPTVTDGSGSQTVFAVPATATAAALAPVVEQVFAAGTDTTNALNGRDRRASATVTIATPVLAPPATLVLATKVDKAIAYPAPVMVDGRPT